MTTILGLNCFHAEAAAALVRDGRVVAAVEEERLNRIKHSAGFPLEAIRYCLRQAGVDLREVDAIALGMRPIDQVQTELLQILSGRPNYSRHLMKSLDAVARFRDVRGMLAREFGYAKSDVPRLEEVAHHSAHVAAAFYGAGVETAALLCVDGFGDFSSTILAKGSEQGIDVLDTVRFPHSLGVFYTMIAQFLGFGRYGDEGKVMGLAALGDPVYRDRLQQVVQLRPDGLFQLDPSYFVHPVHGMPMIWEDRVPHTEDDFSERMIEVFGSPRHRYAELTVRDRDLAASAQAVLEEAVLHLVRRLRERVPEASTLCFAGMVAQNPKVNVAIRRSGLFEDVYVPAAAGDSGTAIGAALVLSHRLGVRPPLTRSVSSQLGPSYGVEAIERAIESSGLRYTRQKDIHGEVAKLLAAGKVVGWFQGRLELGPRALGGRSILADPTRSDMREVMNSRVKFRAAYRPFAASILAEHQEAYFGVDWSSPFMQYAVPAVAAMREKIPAVLHVDGTCRFHTVTQEGNPDLHRLLTAFHELTGTPLLLNTSFNENEPIVCSPEHAIECFEASKIDALALEDFLIQPSQNVG